MSPKHNTSNLLDALASRLSSNTYQMQRIVVLAGVALVALILSFAGYYYYDRFYTSQSSQPQVSIQQAEAAVKADPQNPDLRVKLAETYLLYGRTNDAITQTVSVMQAYPDNQGAWVTAGVAYARNNDCASAIEPLEKYVYANLEQDMAALNPYLRAATYYLGDCYRLTNQPSNAVRMLEFAVDLSKTDADAMYKLGLAYAAAQQNDKAEAVLMRAAAFVPNYTEVYQALTGIYSIQGKTDLVAYANGMVAYATKDYNTALELLLQATAAQPQFAPAFAGLGQTYEALNDLPNAKTAYETAAALDPNNFAATTGVQRVTQLMNK